MRILISRLSALGDTVCSLPAASALKRGFPDSHITWMVDPRFAPIVDCCEAVDSVIPYGFGLGKKPKFSSRFDLALDLQGLFKSAWPILWSGAPTKLAYHWQREGSGMVSRRVLPDPSSTHVVDQYVDVARAAGGDADYADFSLKPRPSDISDAREKLKEGKISGRFVVVNPGAGWASKRWHPEKYGALIDSLFELGIACVLIGGTSEADRKVNAVVCAATMNKPMDLCGQTSIGGLIGLVSMAAAHVGGDTGSSHLASALRRPAIGLYSITRPERSCPYGQIDRCHYEPAGLDRIEPQSVLRSVQEALEENHDA